ncbi:MAG TPA: hypothetical protein PK082_11545, partial [Phycisphaerae bacterium]|nr:hypothetical protein [Phycisphaerae bacterium]
MTHHQDPLGGIGISKIHIAPISFKGFFFAVIQHIVALLIHYTELCRIVNIENTILMHGYKPKKGALLRLGSRNF